MVGLVSLFSIIIDLLQSGIYDPESTASRSQDMMKEQRGEPRQAANIPALVKHYRRSVTSLPA